MTAATPRTPGATTRALVVCMLAALAIGVGPAPAAQAWSDGACEAGEGITVVVDFRSLGGDTVVRCAPSPVESGYDALTRAGLDWTPTQRHPGFLCRIEGVPADDPCVNTPPADAYWSYWRAEPGGSWTYSNYGPASTNPPPGPVEGWSFSTGTEDQPPRIAPPGAAPADPPPPSPSPSPTPEPEPEPETEPEPEPEPAPTTAAPPAAESGPTTQADPTPVAAATPTTAATPTDEASATPERTPSPSPTPSASPSPSASPTPTASASATEAMSDAAADSDDGFPVSSLVAVALVLGIGAGAVVTDRRRRRP